MKHTQAYVICATLRSGTTLLTDLLTATGIAGKPDSFFRLQSMRNWWAPYLNVSTEKWTDEHAFDQSFFNAVLQEGAGGTPVFGMRLMWSQVDNLSNRLNDFYPGLSNDSARLQAAFGPIHFVHLSREDKIAQAISRIKAEQSGLWHIHADGTERERVKPSQALVYDAHKLAKQVAEYEKEDAAWLTWFGQQNIQPIRVTYEALSNNPQTTLATVLSALGLDPTIAQSVEPQTAKLANSESDEWAIRLRSEKIKKSKKSNQKRFN